MLDELELTPGFLELILSIIACRGFANNSRSYTIGPDPDVGRTADKGMASYMIPDHAKQKREESKKSVNKKKTFSLITIINISIAKQLTFTKCTFTNLKITTVQPSRNP